MVADLIMLPVRIGVRATRLWLRAAEETVNVAATAAGRLIEMTSSGSGPAAPSGERSRTGDGGERDDFPARGDRPPARGDRSPAPGDRSPAPGDRSPAPGDRSPAAGDRSAEVGAIHRDAEAAVRQARRETPPGAQPSLPGRAAERDPVHVSEEPTLVEEFAEAGAADGAGAEVHVDAPWEGYAEMSAKEVVARLNQATPAELAAVQLFEAAHRNRQTILNAVQRELRRANGRSSRTQ